MKVVAELQVKDLLDSKLNSTFVALITKQEGDRGMGDFKPISLLGSMYKILINVSARKMRKVLNGVVSQYLNAFVKGRQILDCSPIANEVLFSRITQGVGV